MLDLLILLGPHWFTWGSIVLGVAGGWLALYGGAVYRDSGRLSTKGKAALALILTSAGLTCLRDIQSSALGLEKTFEATERQRFTTSLVVMKLASINRDLLAELSETKQITSLANRKVTELTTTVERSKRNQTFSRPPDRLAEFKPRFQIRAGRGAYALVTPSEDRLARYSDSVRLSENEAFSYKILCSENDYDIRSSELEDKLKKSRNQITIGWKIIDIEKPSGAILVSELSPNNREASEAELRLNLDLAWDSECEIPVQIWDVIE